jgi:hypothetical protein
MEKFWEGGAGIGGEEKRSDQSNQREEDGFSNRARFSGRHREAEILKYIQYKTRIFQGRNEIFMRKSGGRGRRGGHRRGN